MVYEDSKGGKKDILSFSEMLKEMNPGFPPLRLPWLAGDITFGTSVPLIVASRSDSAEHKLRTTITAAFLSIRTQGI